MRTQRREGGVGNGRLVDAGRLRGEELNQLWQFLRHLRRNLPKSIRCMRCLFNGADVSPAFYEQLLLILEKSLVRVSVVLIEVAD